MHLTSYDYFRDRPDPEVGLTRTATLIRQARSEAEQDGALVLLFDNGDALQGGPMGEWAAEFSGTHHPLVETFSALGYDAAGLGNHDFGFGLPFLNTVARAAPYPVISSNAHCPSGEHAWQSSAVLQRRISREGVTVPIQIGILSVLPPQTEMWEAHLLSGKVKTTDILAAAQDHANELRAQGCDLVIALAHTGLGQAEAEAGLENAAIPLAAQLGIDAIIAGHTHLTLPGNAHSDLKHVDCAAGLVHGKPTVMPKWAGSHLGVIDLDLTHDDNAGWRITRTKAHLRAIADGPGGSDGPISEDPEVLRLVGKSRAATRRLMARPVARIQDPVHSYFSYCVADRGMALVAAAQEAALRPFLPGLGLDELPVLSATAPCKFGGRAGPRYFTDVPAGDVSLRHLADMHVFPNTLCAVLATGAQVTEWLEMAAGVYNTLSPDHPTDLIDPDRTGHNFDVIFGVTYQIDLSQPARYDALGQRVSPDNARVRNLSFNGKAVTGDQKFVVALNNYRANGGGHFPIAQKQQRLDLPMLNIRDRLRDLFMANSDKLEPSQSVSPHSFTPLGGAKAILRTGPKALRYLEELSQFAPRDLGLDDDGFLQVELTM